MTAVALQLLRSELPVVDDRVPRCLPPRDPARQRRDPCVAHSAQHLGGQQGARPAGTVDHHVRVGLRQVGRCLEFQKAARNGDGTLNITGAHFIFLTYIEQDTIVATRTACRHIVDTDLRDGPAGRVE